MPICTCDYLYECQRNFFGSRSEITWSICSLFYSMITFMFNLDWTVPTILHSLDSRINYSWFYPLLYCSMWPNCFTLVCRGVNQRISGETAENGSKAGSRGNLPQAGAYSKICLDICLAERNRWTPTTSGMGRTSESSFARYISIIQHIQSCQAFFSTYFEGGNPKSIISLLPLD